MKYQPDFDLISDWGWILPSGNLYACGHHEHTELAKFLLDKKGIFTDDPDKTAEKLGWVKVGRISLDSGLAYCGCPNEEQSITLQIWADMRQLKIEELQTF